MTERLYYDDSYATCFRANVLEAAEGARRVYLDRTAFYPESGGQPSDSGTLNGIPVVELTDEGERVAHVLAAPLVGMEVEGVVDWGRRFDHMQQHSGQHLLSAVLEELFGWKTVSFHLGSESSTIDLETGAAAPQQLLAAETRANELVFANLPLSVSYEHASEVAGLRKASDRTGTLRIVSIEGRDRSACGGTHVRATGEIGPVLLRKTEKIRGNLRLEFLCGMRAVRAARADFDGLTKVAQVFSCSPADAAAMVAGQQAKLIESEKTRRKLAGELALRRGRELHASAAPGASGLRLLEKPLPTLDEETRQEAQGFVEGGRAAYLAWSEEPAAVLLAVSVDAGVHAGNLLKELLAALGGRGGGTAQIAQGSVPQRGALGELLSRLRSVLSAG